MGREEVQGSFFPKKGHTGGVLGDSGYLQGLSLAPPWPLQSLWKRKPCLEEFLCLRCTLPAPHTHSVERLVSSPEELAGDPNKSLKLLGKRKENPETPAGINRDRRGQRQAEPYLAGQVSA